MPKLNLLFAHREHEEHYILNYDELFKSFWQGMYYISVNAPNVLTWLFTCICL